ncbi:YcjF family protein [Thalassovita aquimarina]|uniref:TIGR01620 family protein n=2 Tax=Thalassovita aquimarina TaxID=2785917 RepID=A0ABS5HPC4_9RHOB|nr:TIGR01620 family protein [Thalassovita aquimarina]MBR9650666.1 TIGR01620 family protein [Thalassovita aquimarina]
MTNGPILIDLENAPEAPGPDSAPPIGDEGLPQAAAMHSVLSTAGRKPSRLARWIWGLALSFIGAVVSVAAWDFVTGLIARSPVLGTAVALLGIALLLAVAVAVIRELAAFSRLARIDKLHKQAEEALAQDDLDKARQVGGSLMRLYQSRADLDWARARFEERQGEQFDASALMDLAEAELLAPLDKAAQAEVQAAARQVATVTALVPLALADVAAALTANLRMIRRVAEIYGGRSGTLGSWRLMRAVMAHLVATGAVAVGDDMLGSLAGGGLMSKLSRRFGEGVVNGALTARVGVAAMEVCRPLPFARKRRPSVSALVSRALTGLFSKG